jgi:hypothetical protein
MIQDHGDYQFARMLVMVTPDGKLAPPHVAVELAIVPESGPQVTAVSGPLSDVRNSFTIVLVGMFCAEIATDTGAAELIVTSGTVGLAVGNMGAFTPLTLTTCTVGTPDGSGGL